MNKKQFDALLKEAQKEHGEDKRQRVKDFLKERFSEYEAAKATVARLERQFEDMKKSGYKEIDSESLLELGYDGKD